jgi:hypothetical protein
MIRYLSALAWAILLILIGLPIQPFAAETVIKFDDWQSTNGFEGPRVSHAVVLNGNRLYVLGGLFANGSIIYNDVQFAPLGNDGRIPKNTWQKTTPFPTPRFGLGGVVHADVLYVVGGFSQNGTLDDVQYAQLDADGTIATWITSPNHLNIPRSNHRVEVLITPSGIPYLAAIAGVGKVDQDTVHFDEIEVARINTDGSIGPWLLCPFHLKGGRSAPGTIVNGGRLYVLGGWGDLLIEDVFNDVQYALIRDDGCLDSWHTSPFHLGMPLYGHTAALETGGTPAVFTVLGGNAGQGNYFNNVQFSTVATNGDTTRWEFDTHQFAVPRWGHGTVRYNNFLYVVGGRGRNGDLSDVQFTRVIRP